MAIWESQSNRNTGYICHIIGHNNPYDLTEMHYRYDITDLSIMDIHDVTSIDNPFPRHVTKLSIGSCENITRIHSFPEKLEYLHISYLPNLIEIPELPYGLKSLSIVGTNINYLQSLKHLKLVDCYLHSNNLTCIPELPSTIKNFNCFHNPLNVVPVLPVPIEKMDYVEIYRVDDKLTFEENQLLMARCTEILKIGQMNVTEFNEYMRNLRTYTQDRFDEYIKILDTTNYYDMMKAVYTMSDVKFEHFIENYLTSSNSTVTS